MKFRVQAEMVILAVLALTARYAGGDEKSERFDADPHWEEHNNRSTAFGPRTIVQRFGYSPTGHAGGQRAGELGGLITPAAEPAYYAKKISRATFASKLSASGTLACPGTMPFHALIGFFNSGTLNEWRTPNTIALRIHGRGDVFYAYVEYCTSRWRAGGDSPGGFATVTDPATGRRTPAGFKTGGVVHRWSLSYDPQANNGGGSITARIDDQTAICHLDEGHKADGATFDRFGLLTVMKQWDDPGEVWLDDITVNGQAEDFSSDPGWDGVGNQRTYVTTIVRPRFDFGYSATHFAGGQKPGELGGLVFRGDIRYPERMAYYGDRLEELTLDKPLRAQGTIALRRAVSDSTSLLGFFNSRESIRASMSQSTGFPKCFLGLSVEGPSRAGFFVYPAFHDAGDYSRSTGGDDLPVILPDGAIHRWTLEYRPGDSGSRSRLVASLDGKEAALELAPDNHSRETTFDRFGIITTWIDGNGQHIYFDDLQYTYRQSPGADPKR